MQLTKSICALVAAGISALFLLCGCGHKSVVQHPKDTQLTSATEAQSIGTPSLSATLQELEALQCPASVNPAIFNKFKERLKEKLVERYAGKMVLKAPSPSETRNEIHDLDYLKPLEYRSTGMEFHYRNVGDYDQNGIVNIADVTPLAIHDGETYVQGNDNCYLAARTRGLV